LEVQHLDRDASKTTGAAMRKFHLSVAALILASVSALPASAEPPSFNCAKATYPDEYAICSSAEVSHLDNVADAGYEYVHRVYGNQYARSIDLPLLQARRACAADVACIKEQQLAAIKQFKSLGAPINDLPAASITTPPPTPDEQLAATIKRTLAEQHHCAERTSIEEPCKADTTPTTEIPTPQAPPASTTTPPPAGSAPVPDTVPQKGWSVNGPPPFDA
jgi:uncharacterized protein